MLLGSISIACKRDFPFLFKKKKKIEPGYMPSLALSG